MPEGPIDFLDPMTMVTLILPAISLGTFASKDFVNLWVPARVSVQIREE
jgi:hypothetical protein